MKRTIIKIKIKSLKLYFHFFSFLHFITNKNFFFDKKIKTGIMILALITILNSCKNDYYTKKALFSTKQNNNYRKTDTLIEVINYNYSDNYNYLQQITNDTLEIETIDITCYMVINDNEVEPEKIRNFIENNIKYPQEAIENDIQGTVFIRFAVNKLGKVEQTTILRGVDKSIDSEAVRVINSLPNLSVIKQMGNPVLVFFTIPIKFQLK